DRGVRFKTYATYWVNQAFLNAIYNQSRVVRVPAYIQKAMKKIRDTAATLGTQLDDLDAISAESGVPVELVRTAMNGNRYTLSLDQTLDESTGGSMGDLVEAESAAEPDGAAERLRMTGVLRDAVLRLSLREQKVLQLRFGLSGGPRHTLAGVGERLSISLERVRQIQKGALEKMRAGTGGQLLEQFA
ncbi:MAG TPA: sigma-70 family RNA polymerase sigma factor, partial [Planctomycetota bacterium]